MSSLWLQTGRWALSLTVFAVGLSVLFASLPANSPELSSARGERPLSSRVRGRWIPLRVLPAPVLSSRQGRIDDPWRPDDLSPPQPAPEPVTPPAVLTGEYEIRRGDSWWRIAARLLGDGVRYPELLRLNPHLNERSKLRPGTTIRVPRAAELASHRAVPEPSPAPPAPEETPPTTHVVRSGECLYTIAAQYYDDADWQRIYRANRAQLSSPDEICEGLKLVIPGA